MIAGCLAEIFFNVVLDLQGEAYCFVLVVWGLRKEENFDELEF